CAGKRTNRIGATIPRHESSIGLPALQGALINAHDVAGQAPPGAGLVRNLDVSGQPLAIIKGNHSSPPLLKIASTFFDSTSNAAVSASALSLARSSPSRS